MAAGTRLCHPQACPQPVVLDGPRLSRLRCRSPHGAVTGTPWRAARPPGPAVPHGPPGPPRLVASPPRHRIPVLTAPRGPSATGHSERRPRRSVPALVLVGSPGKDSASPRPPLCAPRNSPASAPTQLPAASSPLPTADPGGGKGGQAALIPPSPRSTGTGAMPAAASPTASRTPARGRRWPRRGAEPGAAPWRPAVAHGAVPNADPTGMSPPCRLAQHGTSRTGIPFPSPTWPQERSIICPSSPQPRVPGDTHGTATEPKPPGHHHAHRGGHAAQPMGIQRPTPTLPGMRRLRQDPHTHRPPPAAAHGDTAGTAGARRARSAAEAAGRGQRSPDLLLLPHHLLSFSLATARSPRPPMAPPSHATSPGDTRHPGPAAPTAPART